MTGLDFAVKNTYGESKDLENRLCKFVDYFSKSDSAFHQMIKVREFVFTKENYYKIHKDRAGLAFYMISSAQYEGMVSERRLYKNLIELC